MSARERAGRRSIVVAARCGALLLAVAAGRAIAQQMPPATAPPSAAPTTIAPPAAAPQAQAPPLAKELYTKLERKIPMRDGVELHAAIYLPKDVSQPHPILLDRTPYSCAPYGEEKFRESVGPSPLFMQANYIVVYEDVRGCYMSGGDFDDMRPHLDVKTKPTDVDESSDTYDTIEWLVKNVPGHNGRVGTWGISYPGFYTSAGMIDAHPALKCASPQAPIADWFFDDFHHHGAFFLPHFFNFMWSFGKPRAGLTTEGRKGGSHGTPDGYQFFLDLGGLSNVDPKWYHDEIPYWKVFAAHPDYDDYWRARNLLPHLHRTAPAVMTVGGWFDAEDLYGALQTYRAVERLNPGITNFLVMGPWSHGGWARNEGERLGNVRFGGKQSAWYRENVEFRFFETFLRDAKFDPLPEAFVFETGANRWRTFAEWPPKATAPARLFLCGDGRLAKGEAPTDERAADRFVSDPRKPVPFTEAVATGMTREYMTDDQRFAARRPDVLTYETEVLTDDWTLAGPLVANLWVSTSHQDADWIVKLIDVFPGDFKYPEDTADAPPAPVPAPTPTSTTAPATASAPATATARAPSRPAPDSKPMGGYEMMVRSESIRGRFRDSYSDPKPFAPNTPTLVKLPLQDVLHTFQKGHRLMIQVQSTWFPLIDRNPQKWVDNIYTAKDTDFVAADHAVYRDKEHASFVEIGVLPAMPDAKEPEKAPAKTDAGAGASGK
jgi:putative CocE/NonD family hydrolase